MPLTATSILNAKPSSKARKLFDERGLYLLVNPRGSKLWRFKYRFNGKEKLLALGAFPEISLKQARDRREKARQQLANGIDPSQVRKTEKLAQGKIAGDTFEFIGREWFNKFSPTWSPSHLARVKRQLEKDLYPWIGSSHPDLIDAPTLLSCLRRIESRGALVSAHRVRGIAGQVFRYAIATGRATRDPSNDLKGALPPVKGKNFAAITDPEKAAILLNAIDNFEGTFVVKCALQLSPLIFARPGEIRHAQWKDIDLKKAEWRYLVTKTQTEHIVPLSSQAMNILNELHPLTGSGKYLFPSIRTPLRPMSENTINASLRRIGFTKEEMTAHGFRAMARTILDEELGFRPEIIEHQLAHAVKDPNGRAYNRTAHLPQRKEMMQSWADFLDAIKNKALDY